MKNLLAILILMSCQASAAILAATDFDGRTVSGATASNLGWSLDGLDDPGTLTALNAGGGNQTIFDGTALVQNIFAPGLNTGNGNTFWTTNVSLVVSSGMNVTLTNISFDYWAVSGGQVQNVDRKSDFTISLFDPSAALVEAVSIDDVNNGTNTSAGSATPVTLTFTTPRVLSAPGTYRLEIKGGDFAGSNETGNHTAIDNLSINGTAAPIPEPSALLLSVFGTIGLCLHRKR